MSEEQNDPVNKPSHYQAGPYECATVARAVFGDLAWAVHCRITAWTYLWRAGKKGPAQEDVAKAARYLAWAEGVDDRQAELDYSEVDQMETELAMARRNEETLKGEIARLRQQASELAQGRLEAQAEVRRLEEIREKNAHTIAEQRKIADYRIELAVEKDETIKSLRRRVNELLKAAKKRASK
jgi:chromosome segregation ATPase